MVKYLFPGTKHEVQIFTNKKPFFDYDFKTREVGVYPYMISLGFIAICWGYWEGEN